MARVLDPPRSDRPAAVAVLFLGFLAALQVADPILASLALVRATQSLGFTPQTQALAASISTLALAATVVPSGVVADKVGRRTLLVGALLLTAVGDALAAAATGPVPFLVGRAVAGVGLGAVFAAAFGFVVSVVTARAFPAALGVFAAMSLAPLLVLMPLASALAGSGWRLAFVVVPVLCVASALLCLAVLPDLAPLPPAPREYWGVTALGIGIVLLLLGISRTAGGPVGPDALGPMAAGAVFLAVFYVVERRAANPVFPVGLFASPLFVAAAIGGFAWNATNAVSQLQSSNLWQYVLGLSPLEASLRQLPLMAVSMVASVLAGAVMARGRSSVSVLVAGGLVSAAGLALTGAVAGSSAGLPFLAFLCVASFGAGVMMVPQGELFVIEAPPEQYGPVTSSRTCVGQLGYAIGLAGGAAIASMVTVSRLVSQSRLSPDDAQSAVGRFLVGEPTGVAELPGHVTAGFAVAMYSFAAAVAGCSVLVWLLGRRAARRAGSARPVAA